MSMQGFERSSLDPVQIEAGRGARCQSQLRRTSAGLEKGVQFARDFQRIALNARHRLRCETAVDDERRRIIGGSAGAG